jgi:hypothetical protein
MSVLTAETLALFIRFWLTITPPLPSDAQAAAQLKSRERFEGFVEALGRRLQKGQSFLREIPEDIRRQGSENKKGDSASLPLPT